MKHKTEAGKCVVCDARARFGGDTCDPLCRRAKNTGRSRLGQSIAEVRAAAQADRLRALSARFFNHKARRVTGEQDYAVA